ncbi:protein-L-isoaspartate O-methyltransferase family protein [Pseudooceanicola nitratireducens]|uniref:protein-L-isoaspartate O-methyltransferase family protein n=1 Tax=Pseudooceanicola nitratireducens TaxID=517719 RepID=UPI001C944E64|nr:protein-L-isoaspartate O-methyltransferase [Pseudooceanicola nitratireducens]MBY6156469.1 protein-L-isoaspartate O-methyltransferase [Pseudooceanicola nitratireducens]MBY6166724.1 protein-L-isoaspartate O-methyltransferase [Pseudooceanicola nitratireducens]
MTDFAARRVMMVDNQIRPSDVTKFPIIDAMLAVPRENFVPGDKKEAAYLGENIDLGQGRVVLEPRTLAKMLDAVDIQPDELVLDLGAGSGYSAAVMARMAEAVIAVEEDTALIADAEQALTAAGADNVVLVEGKLTEGAGEHGPYDVIVVEGAVEHLPEGITDQLRDGGRIIALFAEGRLGVVRVGYRIDGKMTWRFAFNAGAPVLPGFEKHQAFTL